MKFKKIFYILGAGSIFLLGGALIAKGKNPAPLFENLGKFHHKIDTQNKLTQRYFDQGLVLLYSFEFGESIRSFKAAIRTDPNCAMCYWGLALALGSKTDMPLNGQELTAAKAAIYSAMEKVDKRNISEKLYIAALSQRYTDVLPQKMDEFAGLCSSYSAVTGNNATKYANAMKKVATIIPNDADGKTLYAAALFDLSQWNFWQQNGLPYPYTEKTIHTLESALQLDANHPGANHLYVHIMEFSPFTKKALPNAERLSQLVPGSEHLAHMPCHIFYTLGHYHKASIANQIAIKKYKEYEAACKKQGFAPEIQYLYFHNYNYLTASASMEGRKALSIATADELANIIYPFIEKNPALQKNLTDRYLMRVRFGKWPEILTLSKPSSSLQYALGIWHYARGIAELRLKHFQAAEENLSALQKIISQGSNSANLGKFGISLLHIAEYILAGSVQVHLNNNQQALVLFNKSIAIQDTLLSADPPSWYFPTRQLLGDFLLKTRQFNEAKTVYLEDLKKHPDNGWSLFGLAESLRKSGKKEEAQEIEHKFQNAWRYADISLPVSLLGS